MIDALGLPDNRELQERMPMSEEAVVTWPQLSGEDGGPDSFASSVEENRALLVQMHDLLGKAERLVAMLREEERHSALALEHEAELTPCVAAVKADFRTLYGSRFESAIGAEYTRMAFRTQELRFRAVAASMELTLANLMLVD